MTDRTPLLELLHRALPALKERYPIRSLGLFGSFARGDMSESSDLDILVDFARPVSLSRFLALEEELGQLTGRNVDLVSRESLKPHIGRNVLRDLVPV
ncbi:MAG TPA: nucleotidyltransferase family protein [Candidatus Bathyarchaeia archaeon]|nr:nucleotidyltransferase family protein [Candidatus Bathyarchaeia archaeon]